MTWTRWDFKVSMMKYLFLLFFYYIMSFYSSSAGCSLPNHPSPKYIWGTERDETHTRGEMTGRKWEAANKNGPQFHQYIHTHTHKKKKKTKGQHLRKGRRKLMRSTCNFVTFLTTIIKRGQLSLEHDLFFV